MSNVVELETVKRYELFLRKTAEHPYYSKEGQFASPFDIYDFIIRNTGLDEKPFEHIMVLGLDSRFRIRGYSIIGMGNHSNIVLSPSNVFTFALETASSRIVLAHNHPSGDRTPSKADIDFTRAIIESGRMLGIYLADHLIITEDSYHSMAVNEDVDFNLGGELDIVAKVAERYKT